MQTLSPQQTEQASGGSLRTTPAVPAIANSIVLSPLVFAFAAGYAIGTWVYQHVIDK